METHSTSWLKVDWMRGETKWQQRTSKKVNWMDDWKWRPDSTCLKGKRSVQREYLSIHKREREQRRRAVQRNDSHGERMKCFFGSNFKQNLPCSGCDPILILIIVYSLWEKDYDNKQTTELKSAHIWNVMHLLDVFSGSCPKLFLSSFIASTTFLQWWWGIHNWQ